MALLTWLASSMDQHFPNSSPRNAECLFLRGALNERFGFQVGTHTTETFANITVEARAPAGWLCRVRRIGYVPLWHRNGIANPEADGHLPGLQPEPLWDENRVRIEGNETQAFYITVEPDADTAPGEHTIEVAVQPEKGRPRLHSVTVYLYDLRIKPRRDFHVTNWFTADALMDWYGCRGFDEKLWALLPAYFANMVSHGQNMISTPILNWSTRRPTQLLRVRRDGDNYQFDFSLVKRWVDLARAAGFTAFEWMDLFTWWNAAFTAKVYEGDPEDARLIWRTRPDETTPHYKKYAGQIGVVDCPDATGPESRAFFGQFLPALECFLRQENLLDKSWFHIGDEPEAENAHNYRKTRAMLRELAPWMKVTDPFCHMEYTEPGLIDLPFPRTKMVADIQARGLRTAAYYCGNPGPTVINRLMDTPLSQVRMNGWTFYRFDIDGFLHWAYNFWYRGRNQRFVPADPFANFDSFVWPHYAYGDCWSVYPGPDGPIDTLRWEAFSDSLQDYALLQTLNVARDDVPLRDIEGFDRFPVSQTWIEKTRQHYLEKATGS